MKRKLLLLLTMALALVLSLGILTACDKDMEFTVTVKDGDTVLKTLSFDKDATISIDPHDSAFDKAGYEVEGLYTDAALTAEFGDEITATADLTLYVKYTPRPFKIIVIDDSNSINYTTVDVTYNSAYTLTAPNRTGYVFLGYTHVKNGTPTAFPLTGTYTETNTISVSAQWKKLASVTVYDEVTDEQVGTAIYADAEGNFTLPAVTTTKAGYNFGGYVIPGVTLTRQDDGTYTGKVTSDGDLTATLKWTPVPTYLLTVNGLYDDDVVAPASYKTGDTFTLPAAPTREGYRFLGYKVGNDFITATNGAYTFTWSEATTVTAIWQQRIYITVQDEYTNQILGRVEVVDGAYDLSDYVLTGADASFTEGDVDYTYAGFIYNSQPFAVSGTGYTGGSITVIRDWNGVEKIYLNVISVGAVYPFTPVEIVDGAYTPLIPFELNGYYFIDFFADEACTEAFANTGAATTDVTVYAKWVKKTTVKVYKVYYDYGKLTDQQPVETIEADVNGKFVLPAVTTEEGYIFGGYVINGVTLNPQTDGSYTGTVSGGAELTATQVWNNIPEFNWSVNANGGSFANNAVTSGTAYESTAIALPAPTREGYIFKGYAYGDGTMLAKNSDLYVLPDYDGVPTSAVRLTLTAVWEADKNAEGEWIDKDTGESRNFFREVVDGELVYVFLTGRFYGFGDAELTFGGNYTTVITAGTDPEKGNGFTADAPGSFTMTQNGQTVNCRVEYYVGSMAAGSSTTGRIESNFMGKIDKKAFDAGIKDFLPDLVGGNVAIDKIPYEIVSVVDEKGNTIDPNLYWIEANGKLTFDSTLIGGTDPVETLTITYKPKYSLRDDNVSASVTIRPNKGVNVYTNDELYAAYADLNVDTINILRNITAELQPQHYSHTEDGQIVVHNDDYANGVYLRMPTGGDMITINGNCYTIDGGKLPAINPELVAVDEKDDFYDHDDAYYGRWSDGYTGWDDGVYQLVNAQVGIFVYYQEIGDSATQAGGTLTLNDLHITGNEYEITKTLDAGTTKSYWEKTYNLKDDGSKVVVGSSGAMHGIIVRQANAVLDNVKVEHTQSGMHTDGYDHTYEDNNEIKHAGTPTALLTKVTMNNAIFDQNFNSSFFAWGQVGLEITNSKLGRSAGPAIIFSDTPIKPKEGQNYSTIADFQSYIDIDANTVIENFVSGAEPWFQAYRAEGAALDVKTKLAGDGTDKNPGFYPSIKANGYPVLLTPLKEVGLDKVQTFNAMIVTNAARTDDPYNEDLTVLDTEDGIPVGVPFVKISIGDTPLSTEPAIGDSPEIPPLPLNVGTKFYQHLPMTGADANSMQVILEAYIKE